MALRCTFIGFLPHTHVGVAEGLIVREGFVGRNLFFSDKAGDNFLNVTDVMMIYKHFPFWVSSLMQPNMYILISSLLTTFLFYERIFYPLELLASFKYYDLSYWTNISYFTILFFFFCRNHSCTRSYCYLYHS
ncbi:uncharacterized protein BX663DRAFT_507381 [Cokeromyces recurvatus]|uniref:uncharacterized protein n=1 Tax=Cokeromyces recurvatus TaxID=90255 RepID=UPI00222071B0|nr:uncharacterized protein BX663DRAFT_507381 [Cokeromyces recurvatus]KAI7903721.1 hypothetical protein BX663DRAFT_507381 [Cokeromyces recurvatus]